MAKDEIKIKSDYASSWVLCPEGLKLYYGQFTNIHLMLD